MKIPNKIEPITYDWDEVGAGMLKETVNKLDEVIKTVNDLLEFHYQWHSPENHKSCGSGCKHPSHDYEANAGGGGASVTVLTKGGGGC